MRVDTIERNIQRSSSFEERAMGLAIGSEAFVFNVLRKDLYSDPIGSLIREYAVNAQDEHRKFGKTDTPIFIQVPNQFLPELHIRDYANGLTEEQVFNFFGNYGASDKRDTNDAVGFFGLGCKSAFAYTDSYIVKSFKDGKVLTFNVYIDETEIGRLAKISEGQTNEPNGVEIIVPVKTSNIQEFQNKVIKTVKYFQPMPKLAGLSYTPEFNKDTPVIEGKGWKFFGSGSAVAIMGEIAYSIPLANEFEIWEQNLISSGVEIVFPIGEVQVTASREALQMSPKTIKAIRTRLEIIKNEMLKEVEKSFKNAKNLVEAKSLYYSLISSGNGFSRIVKASKDAVNWKGIAIKDNIIRLTDGRVMTYALNYRGKVKTYDSVNLMCGNSGDLYFDDTNKTKVNYSRRAMTLLNASNKNFSVIQSNDIPELEKTLGMKVSELKSFNAVVPTKPVSATRLSRGSQADRKKHTARLFKLKVDSLSTISSIASEHWDIVEVDKLEGVFIPIDRFKPNLRSINSIYDLKWILSKLKGLGINVDVPIYGIKASDSADGLVSFDKWINQKLSKLTEKQNEAALITEYRGNVFSDVSSIDVSQLTDGLAKDYVELYKKVKKLFAENNNTLSLVFSHGDVKIEPSTKLSEMAKRFNEAYPMISLVDSYNLKKSVIVDYLNEKTAK